MSHSETPLIVIVGPTASGKSTLALYLAERIGGEIISCDSVAIYRGMDVGSAKPSASARVRVPHYGLDLLDPDQISTAGDYRRLARAALSEISRRGRVPILSGGTGLYLRATLEGLTPAPPRDDELRERLRSRASRRAAGWMHRLLRRLDPQAAGAIHPNDHPKLLRSVEMTILARRPQTVQWAAGRDPLLGCRTLQLGLDPPRADLYKRIDERAAAMFTQGLLEETAAVWSRYGESARALGSLGYAQALAVLLGRQALPQAIAEAQQGHRNYAKRQMTWFRRSPGLHWLKGFGDDPGVRDEALRMVERHLTDGTEPSREA